jgi:hypothetical protein
MKKLCSTQHVFQVLEILHVSACALQELVTLKLSAQHEYDSAYCKWLDSRTGTMQLKLGILTAEIEADTYSAEIIPALQTLGATLGAAHLRASTESNQTDIRLAHYKS